MNWNNDNMTCEQARAAIADSIIGASAAGEVPAFDAHLASCAACRSYRAECQTMWDALVGLPAPSPAPGARAQFEKAIGREVHVGRPRRVTVGWTRRSLIAAGFVGAVLLGYGAASLRSDRPVTPTVTATDPASHQYLLLLYDPQTSAAPSDAQIASTIAEYSAWARGLAANGKLVSAEKLSDAPSEWFGGSVATATGERIGGFFLIRAADIVEARRIAQDCPHVKRGGRVELRAIQKT